MVKHPFLPIPDRFEDDSSIPKSTVYLTLTQTSLSSQSMNSVPHDFDPDAMVDSFVAATSVHGFFEEKL